MKIPQTAVAAIAVNAVNVLASSNPIGAAGYRNYTTTGFTLELDNANQVATRLISVAGSNSGSSPFNFLLPSAGRQDDGNYVSR